MPAPSNRYTARHFQDIAALLAAEREQNGPSPALSRIITEFAALLAENSASFNRKLFGQAARGQVAPTARKTAEDPAPTARRPPPVRAFRPAVNGWTPPVATPIQEGEVATVMQFLGLNEGVQPGPGRVFPPDAVVIRRTRWGWSAFSGDNIAGSDGLISSSDHAGSLAEYVLTLEPSEIIIQPGQEGSS